MSRLAFSPSALSGRGVGWMPKGGRGGGWEISEPRPSEPGRGEQVGVEVTLGRRPDTKSHVIQCNIASTYALYEVDPA